MGGYLPAIAVGVRVAGSPIGREVVAQRLHRKIVKGGRQDGSLEQGARQPRPIASTRMGDGQCLDCKSVSAFASQVLLLDRCGSRRFSA